MRPTSDKTQAFEGVFVSILLIAIITLTVSVLTLGNAVDFSHNVRDAFAYLEVRPEAEAEDFDEIPTDEAELKDFAVMLFNMGGTKCKDAPGVAAYCACVMKMTVMNIENYVDIDASIIKTQDEYFRTDYRLELDLPFKKALGEKVAGELEMILAERVYTNTDYNYLQYQKVKNSDRKEDGVPTADWSGEIINEHRDLPVYNSTQDGIFELIGYNITAEAIKSVSAELIQSEEGNYYSVQMTMDTRYAPLTERVIDTIRSGSKDPNANYKKITYDFELWDNGYFKSARIFEYWTAKAMGKISFATESDYEWQFSYDEGDSDPDAFNDCIAMKKAMGLI